MNPVVQTVAVPLEELPEQQIYRYMGLGGSACDAELAATIRQTMLEFLPMVQCKVCYCVVPLTIHENEINCSLFSLRSKDLARNLQDCTFAVLFAATLGMAVERQRRRAAVISPVKALVLDAMGSVAIEACCNRFSAHIAKQFPDYKARPRFSPGYGDFPLETQSELLSVLDAARTIGVTLSEGMLMIPQKSVSAVMGFGKQGCDTVGECDDCNKEHCEFRR